MRVYNGSIGTVRYPDEVTFAFNPNIIKVVTDKAVTVTVGRYTDTREPYQTMVTIDIARYLQTMVSKDRRSAEVTVELSDGENTFSFGTVVVWGALNIGEVWNDEQTVTWWKNLPFTFGLYIPDGATVMSRYDGAMHVATELGNGVLEIDPSEVWPNAMEKAVIRVQDSAMSGVFDYTFDYTFNGMKRENFRLYRLEVDERTCGVYLRWIDRHGWMRYWLFEEGETSEVTKGGDVLRGVYVGETAEYRKQEYAAKDAGRSVKLCAPLVDEGRFAMLTTLCTSVSVELYTGSEWVPVAIEGRTVVRQGVKVRRPLNDFECVMTLPEVMVQRL